MHAVVRSYYFSEEALTCIGGDRMKTLTVALLLSYLVALSGKLCRYYK